MNGKIDRPMPVPEHTIVCLLLTFTGGFLDAYTYFLRGGVFANAQSGNMILMSIHLAQREWMISFNYLVPILAYAAGILCTSALRAVVGTRGSLHWRQPLVLLELLLLLGVSFVPANTRNDLVNLTISFICAVQVGSFSRFHGLPFASTMCTGNLRSATENFFDFLMTRDKALLCDSLRYFSVIGMFILSALTGVFLIEWFAEKSIWVCCGVLAVVLVYLIVTQDSPATCEENKA